MNQERKTTGVLADWRRFTRWSLVVGVVGLALLALGAVLNQESNPSQFFRSYLIGFIFWWGLGLGCLALLMLHNVSGGRWGVSPRPYFSAGVSVLPLAAILFVPLAFGLEHVYEWARDDAVAHDPLLQHKQPYLNVPFFLIRAAGYFAVWIVLGWVVTWWSARLPDDQHRWPAGLQRLSAGGLLVIIFTTTFAAFDWIMSLEPHWYSTIFGAWIAIGALIGGFALVILSITLVAGNQVPVDEHHEFPVLGDLGNLLLAFLMLWAYFGFSQFFIIWSGDLPEETFWFLKRLDGGWQWVMLLIALLHFVVPFLLLLSRDIKRNPRSLGLLALGVLCIHAVDLYWVIAPAFYGQRLSMHWIDLAALAGIGGLWLAFFSWQVGRRLQHATA